MIYTVHPVQGGPIKIGCSEDPNRRRGQLSALFPYDVEILNVFEGDRRHENFLHMCFRPVAVATEWFKPCPAIWRFVIEVEDNGVPVWLKDAEQFFTSDARDSFVDEFDSPRDAITALGYSLKTSVADTINARSSKAAAFSSRVAFLRMLSAGNLPKYIADLHDQAEGQVA